MRLRYRFSVHAIIFRAKPLKMIAHKARWRESVENSALGSDFAAFERRCGMPVRVVERDTMPCRVSAEYNHRRLNVKIEAGKIVLCVGWY